MILHVASRRDQAMNLSRQYPDDHVVSQGDRLAGMRFTKIIDHRFHQETPALREQARAYWNTEVLCRLEVGGTIE